MTVLAVALSSSGSAVAQTDAPAVQSDGQVASGKSGAVAHAYWVNRPETLDRLTALSTAAVVASPITIVPGPSLVTDDLDVAPIPTQRVTFKVEEKWFGDVPDEFVLFKTGSSEQWIEHDPPYQSSERYVLFMQPRPDGLYIPAAPDGRLGLDNGRVKPFIPGPLAQKFAGVSVEDLRQMAKSEKRRSG